MKDIVSDWATKNQIQLSWPDEFAVKSGDAFSLVEQFDFQKMFVSIKENLSKLFQ